MTTTVEQLSQLQAIYYDQRALDQLKKSLVFEPYHFCGAVPGMEETRVPPNVFIEEEIVGL